MDISAAFNYEQDINIVAVVNYFNRVVPSLSIDGVQEIQLSEDEEINLDLLPRDQKFLIHGTGHAHYTGNRDFVYVEVFGREGYQMTKVHPAEFNVRGGNALVRTAFGLYHERNLDAGYKYFLDEYFNKANLVPTPNISLHATPSDTRNIDYERAIMYLEKAAGEFHAVYQEDPRAQRALSAIGGIISSVKHPVNKQDYLKRTNYAEEYLTSLFQEVSAELSGLIDHLFPEGAFGRNLVTTETITQMQAISNALNFISKRAEKMTGNALQV